VSRHWRRVVSPNDDDGPDIRITFPWAVHRKGYAIRRHR
jgi:hypothetical protein